MLREGRLIAVVVFAMLLGAAATLFSLNVPGKALAAMGPSIAILALLLWVRALVLFARREDQENPWEVASSAAAAVGISAILAGCLVERQTDGLEWTLLIAGFALALASVGLKLRAITRKYANKRKAQSA